MNRIPRSLVLAHGGCAPSPGTPLHAQPVGGACGRGRRDRSRPDVASIAGTVADALRSGRSLVQEPAADPGRRTSVLALATPEYDVWVLRWPRGTRVDPHDHGGSAAALSVVHGKLVEVRWQHGEAVFRKVASPAVVTVDPGVVHDVVGATSSALSVHVYSPPLSTMGFYDPTGTRLLRVEAVDHDHDPHPHPATVGVGVVGGGDSGSGERVEAAPAGPHR